MVNNARQTLIDGVTSTTGATQDYSAVIGGRGKLAIVGSTPQIDLCDSQSAI